MTDETILAIAQGSPGEAIATYELLSNVPQELLTKLTNFPKEPLSALILAKELSGSLDTEVQMRLIDYLQYQYWQQTGDRQIIERLEQTRKYLRSYVQPRLVWESFFLKNCPA